VGFSFSFLQNFSEVPATYTHDGGGKRTCFYVLIDEAGKLVASEVPTKRIHHLERHVIKTYADNNS